MKRIMFAVAFCFVFISGPSFGAPVGEVNPMIGTGGIGYGVGSAYPGACVPFGVARPSPDTSYLGSAPSFHHCGGYHHGDNVIRGFSHVRLSGVGIADYGNVLVMPTSNRSGLYSSESSYQSLFSHSSEEASPGYYAVTLLGSGIRAELTATAHCGVHRYDFGGGVGRVIVDARHAIMLRDVLEAEAEVDEDAREVSGRVFTAGGFTGRNRGVEVFFVARFESEFLDRGEFGDGGGVWVDVDADEPVVLAVGISYISLDQARRHLNEEVGDRGFDDVLSEAERLWEEALSPIDVVGGTPDQRAIFATSLYHVMIMPTDFTEAGGLYRGLDDEVHVAEGFRYYTDFSLWDTFRTLHPLLNLIDHKRSGDMMRSLVVMAEQGGYLPKWPTTYRYTNCMIGASADNAIADAVMKGVPGFDVETAYRAMRELAMGPPPEGHDFGGRVGIEDYVELGYVPVDKHGGAASRTIEFSYNDWCLAQVAKKLGKDGDYRLFMDRSRNWRNIWDEKSGYLRGRKSDGSFKGPFAAWSWTGYYVEGNARQWLWAPLHDAPGLIEIMGGPDAFVERLEEFFAKSATRPNTLLWDNFYWHGNEPDIHAAYLFNFAGRPDLAQKWVRWTMDKKYQNAPHGLDGNDDAGTLSAWYVFSAIGFYPLAGSDLYLIGSPIFEQATLNLPGGVLKVMTTADPADNLYVEGVTINGRELDGPWFRHAEIAGGGEIVFSLTDTPSDWGSDSPPDLTATP